MKGSGDVELLRAGDIPEALELKARWGEEARFIAGGTDLVLQTRAGKRTVSVLIALPRVSAECCVEEGLLKIPALAPISSLLFPPQRNRNEADTTSSLPSALLDSHRLGDGSIPAGFAGDLVDKGLVGKHAPALALALLQVGSPLIRNAATLGGNLCNASPAADSAPALIVHRGQVVLASVRGKRVLPVEEFFLGPGRTVLEPDELLTEVWVPVAREGEVFFFRKFGPRRANVISSASFAAGVLLSSKGRVDEVRLAAGGVAPVPLRLTGAERALAGKTLSGLRNGGEIERIVETVKGEVAPISDVRGSAWYKTRVVELSLKFFLESLAEGTVRGGGLS